MSGEVDLCGDCGEWEYECSCEPTILLKIQNLESRIEKLREAHQKNADEDYRGNRHPCSVRSFKALAADDELKGEADE